jgi:BirA family biotin operon repressor/biotin-[acetyl-CoA-carboxylase] ligase
VGIYLIILLKPDKAWQDMQLLTICAAVAVSKAIEAACGIRADIKWVNDIFCNGKKICGILAEAVMSGGSLGHGGAQGQAVPQRSGGSQWSSASQRSGIVIVGIGVNTGEVPTEIGDIATSIWEATGARGLRNRLIAEMLNQFEAAYAEFAEGGDMERIIGYYRSRLFIIGKRILVADTAGDYSATVLGIDDKGALVVRDDQGAQRHISTGEIR